MNYDASNEMFGLAVNLVNQSGRNIFLTGKAGTGKTTFLKYIRENCSKQMAVVAPTGVAAINAGGVTIHSFFQLPLSPFVPNNAVMSPAIEAVVNRHSLVRRLRFNRDKIKLLKQLELVVIDEISMVRCDILDAVDTVLRHVRRRPHERFGGVQMLFIGDMFQLPPVIKDTDWRILSEYYSGPYFFDSLVIKEDPPVYIEFDKIYRQSEVNFISLLNQVRNNELNDEGIRILEERYQPSFRRTANDGYIILTTHNETARNINNSELARLDGKTYSYRAETEGEMPENAFPADEVLCLKTGAQVMFIRNDTDKAKRFFNGKLGVITGLSDDKIFVRCRDDSEEIEVRKEKWDNIRYSLNKTTRVVEEELLGSFIQYPLRLAWAITIHKSQGLTFEKAIVDAGEAFASGQVYVALSRCTTLHGLVLKSKIRTQSLMTDQRIVEFSKRVTGSRRVQEELIKAKRDYLKTVLLKSFDFKGQLHVARELSAHVVENKNSFNEEVFGWIADILTRLDSLQQTAGKFQSWINSLFVETGEPETDKILEERTRKAAEHFIKEMSGLTEILQKSPAVTDSRSHAKEYNEGLRELFIDLCSKTFFLEGFNEGLDVERWNKRKRNFVSPPFNPNAYAGTNQAKRESHHPALHQQLRKLRDSICLRKDLPIYMVAGSKTLDEMCQYLPHTRSELRQIRGFGDVKIDQYGQQFLDVIVAYCEEKDLSSLIHEKASKEEKTKKAPGGMKSETKAETFRLYKEGKGVADIARERKLTTQTIEGHLAFYVAKGDIHIEDLVSPEKIAMIEPLLKEFNEDSITPIKAKLGAAVGYGEIRLVIAWQRYQNNVGQPK